MAPATTPGYAWKDGFGLGGGIVDDPAVAPNADDRLQVFVRGGGSDLYTKWQNPDWSWYKDWHQFPNTAGTVDGSPIALRNPSGRVHVFWRGPDNSIWHLCQQVINGGWGSPERIASGAASNPAAALNADGRISVFYNGTDRALWHVDQTQLDYAGFGRPDSLAGDTGANHKLAPTVARNGEGRLEVFVHGLSDEVWGNAQKVADATTSWVGYFRVSDQDAGVIGSPFAVTDADQRIRVFWRAGNTGFHAVHQPGYTGFKTPQALTGKIMETPTAILAMDGRLEVFVVADDRALYATEQQKANEDAFTQVDRIGGNLPGLPIPAKHHDNRILVAHRGSDNAFWAFQQNRT
ncbi:hypothetical protein [Streptomyces lasiicapitis]|uniref:PLL-like beta propeller domain-containing protein n=1 Tax=Streptomyces lasiicapitis TaxID=1923961 RepID=A0ABQ2M8T8_9ACTN|nr:hypothetical protein [Streptomyces lasiicapitis]GGO48650.1 hypothetical protein GCM10012286_44760 [Streptomyces lasiicapitis]